MENSKFYYLDGDAKKTPIDPTKQENGTIMVLVLPNGKEIKVKAGDLVIADQKAYKEKLEQNAKIEEDKEKQFGLKRLAKSNKKAK